MNKPTPDLLGEITDAHLELCQHEKWQWHELTLTYANGRTINIQPAITGDGKGNPITQLVITEKTP